MMYGSVPILATPTKSRMESNGSFVRSAALAMNVKPAIRNVWPSAGARATSSVPITVPAPGRLSTTTLWPNAFVSGGASARAATSTDPEGGNGTTIRKGFEGNCASAKLSV
jgi:hypothetical protein